VVTSARYVYRSAEVAARPELLPMVLQRNAVFLIHVGGGIVALAVGAWNLREWSSTRFLNLHRWLGRLYLVSVLSGGLAGSHWRSPRRAD